MVEDMVKRINYNIKLMVRDFEITHRHDSIANARISGMIEMLEMVTGKSYYYDEHGVREE